MPALFLGIEIGGTKLQLALGDAEGRLIQRVRRDIPRGGDAEGIRAALVEGLEDLNGYDRPAATGIGFGGPVDWRTGRIRCSHQVKGWAEFDLAAWAQEVVRGPVVVENDANTAALAEAVRGAGTGRGVVFYVTLGSGVGGGLVVGGSIYHGAPPGEAEIGHVRLDRTGVTVEDRCSGWALDGRIRSALRQGPEGVLARLAGGANGGEARHLPAALRAGDPTAAAVLEDWAQDLAFGLSHAVHLFHPDIVILGGGVALAGDPIRSAVARCLEPHLMTVFRPAPEVALASLAEDAVPTGAILLAARRAARQSFPGPARESDCP